MERKEQESDERMLWWRGDRVQCRTSKDGRAVVLYAGHPRRQLPVHKQHEDVEEGGVRGADEDGDLAARRSALGAHPVHAPAEEVRAPYQLHHRTRPLAARGRGGCNHWGLAAFTFCS